MTLISLLVALAIVQLWGIPAFLHRDQWFDQWSAWLGRQASLRPYERLLVLINLWGPVLALLVLVGLVSSQLSRDWLVLINIPVLLYCLDRGDFNLQVKEYLDAWYRQDSASASKHLATLQLKSFSISAPETLEPNAEEIQKDDWSALHQQALSVIAYRGFERLFAVLFWFVLLGAVGALIYRLSVLLRQKSEHKLIAQCLWLLEWPAVRALGLIWAVVGNFVSCIACWQSGFLCRTRSSGELLRHYLLGALSLNEASDDEIEGRVKPEALQRADSQSGRQIEALLSLHSRSLWLWVCLVAVLTIFG